MKMVWFYFWKCCIDYVLIVPALATSFIILIYDPVRVVKGVKDTHTFRSESKDKLNFNELFGNINI